MGLFFGEYLRWFGYIQKREINAPVRKSELIKVERTKKW
jgi:hypothetical protein